MSAQGDFVPLELDPGWEEAAQRYAALVIRTQARLGEARPPDATDYQSVDVASLDLFLPRSVGVEHVALEAFRQIGLDRQLEALGFNKRQLACAMGTIIGRMVNPGSELYTHSWLQRQSALGELIEQDFAAIGLMPFYRIADRLFGHKEVLERFLYARERDLFEFEEVITLYDLTNNAATCIAANSRFVAVGGYVTDAVDDPNMVVRVYDAKSGDLICQDEFDAESHVI